MRRLRVRPASSLQRLQATLASRLATFAARVKSLASYSALLLVALGLYFVFQALVLRFLLPRDLLVVQTFEVAPEIAKSQQISANAITDIFTDRINQITTEASQFYGLTLGSTTEHYGKLKELIRIPVKTSFTFQIKGVSVDDMVQVYDRLRYRNISVSGDVYLDGGVTWLRVRLNRSSGVSMQAIPLQASESIPSGLRRLAVLPIAWIDPETVGRMYLDEGKLREAGQVFLEWAKSDPLNSRPYFFLTLVYQGMYDSSDPSDRPLLASGNGEVQIKALADWTNDIDHFQTACSGLWDDLACAGYRVLSGTAPERTPSVAELAEEAVGDADILGKDNNAAIAQFQYLVDHHPSDLNARIDLGVALSDRADLLKDPVTGTQDRKDSLAAFQVASKLAPTNPLVEQYIGTEMWNLNQQQDAITHEMNAVHLQPTRAAAWPGVRVHLLSLPKPDLSRAAHLCHALLVLQTDSLAATASALSATTQDLARSCGSVFAANGEVVDGLNLYRLMDGDKGAESDLRQSAGKKEFGKLVGAALDQYDANVKASQAGGLKVNVVPGTSLDDPGQLKITIQPSTQARH